MDQFFHISIKEEMAIINTNHKKDIVAKFKDHEIVFENINGFCLLKFEQLQLLADQEQSGKIHLYYRTNEIEDTITDIKIRIEDDAEFIVENNLMTTFNEKKWIFYVTTKGTFNCLFNKNPSYKSYYLDNYLTEMQFKDDYLHIEFNLITKYLKANAVKLIIKNRLTKELVAVTGVISSSKKNNHNYLHVVVVKISQVELCSMISNQNNTTNSDKLDLYLDIEYLESNVVNKNIRINYSKANENNYIEEIWVDEFNDMVYGFFPYATKTFFNFSLHTTILNKNAYKIYIDFVRSNYKANSKKIFVVGEYPTKAQDNGLHFFKYVNQFLYEEFECYYVISENSEDLKNLNDYQERILYAKSPAHIEKLLNADIIAHTHSDDYLYPFISSALSKKIKAKKIFLQHGYVSIKDLSYLYGKNAYPFDTDYFVVSSERERLVVIDELGYSPEEVLLTGLSRLDALLTKEKKSFENKLKKRISKSNLRLLIMPTYRKGIKSIAEFLESDYYKGYQALINSEKLLDLVQKYSLEIQFYLHVQFQSYTKHFTSDFVEIVEMENHNLQDLLKSNDLMITDYSSVGFDFALMKKRVIYYQFDRVALEYADRADLKSLLPGDILNTENEVIEEVNAFINGSQKIKKEHRNKLKNLFLFNDRKSNQRLMNEIRKILN